MAERKVTELEALGVEINDINGIIEDLKARRSDVRDQVKRLRGSDMELSHAEIVKARGHRVYVGGHTPEKWYGIGKLQYHFLVSKGLKHNHNFLDIACGSLRLGQYLIPYLDRGRYFGLDGSRDLIEAGLNHELLFDLTTLKSPKFASNYGFDFSFIEQFDMAIAQSLLTHLNRADIAKLFGNLHAVTTETSRFFFTFFEGSEEENKHEVSHPNKRFEFPFATIQEIAEAKGWDVSYLGDWGHPAKQMMVEARPKR